LTSKAPQASTIKNTSCLMDLTRSIFSQAETWRSQTRLMLASMAGSAAVVTVGSTGQATIMTSARHWLVWAELLGCVLRKKTRSGLGTGLFARSRFWSLRTSKVRSTVRQLSQGGTKRLGITVGSALAPMGRSMMLVLRTMYVGNWLASAGNPGSVKNTRIIQEKVSGSSAGRKLTKIRKNNSQI
jgi:hypothetical protein